MATMMKRLARAGLVLVIASGCTAFVSSTPAAASVLGVQCLSGSQSQHNNPGFTFALQNTHITLNGQVSSCVDLSRPGRVSANLQGTGSGQASCLAGFLVTNVTYVWNDGGASRILFQAGVDLKPAGQSVVVVNGQVISGDYAGRAAVKTITLLTTDATGCLTAEGVEEVSGLTNLVIL